MPHSGFFKIRPDKQLPSNMDSKVNRMGKPLLTFMKRSFALFILANFVVACWCFSNRPAVAEDDWASIRGNDGLGKWTRSTRLSQVKNVGLKIRWKKKIGSGYSSVVVSDGKVATQYTDGKQDFVACFSQATGKEKWKVATGPVFRGANGSFDGPLSTPLIYSGLVYALSADGKFFAIELDSGRVKWMRDFVSDEKATQPMYGFSTTPVIADGTICVLVGAKNGVLIGIDPVTGSTKWYAGTGMVSSQIPLVTKVNARTIVATGCGRNVIGVDPEDGKMLFEFAHGGSNGSAMMPVPLPENGLLFTNDDSFSKVFTLKPNQNGFDASEKWSSKGIKNSYNVPVSLGGNLFAYSTRILTCVDEKTGKPNWKSRKPGDGFLISVDGRLVIVTKKGSLHIALADKRKYEEIAGIKVFDDLVWAIPAYADDAIFIRSFGELACVEIVDADRAVVANEKSESKVSPSFERFLASVGEVADMAKKQEMVDRFLKDHQSKSAKSAQAFPIIEDGIAHFVYRGAASDVAVACDVFGARQEKKMQQLAGTNMHYFGLELPAKQRISYIFLVDYKPMADPLNSRSMTSSMYAGEMEFAIRLRNEKPLEMSWFGMSQWTMPKWMNRPIGSTALSGKMKSASIEIEGSPNFEFDVYLPPSYEKNTERKFPTVYVHGGSAAKKLGDLVNVADQFFEETPAKESIVVFLNTALRDPAVYNKVVADEVVGYVDGNFRTKSSREHRLSYGSGFTAGTALDTVTEFPTVFGSVAIQSPLIFDAGRQAAAEGVRKLKLPTRIYMEWGRFDMNNPVENWDIRTMASSMAEEFKKNNSIKVSGGMVNDSTDWGSWKLRFHRIIETMMK